MSEQSPPDEELIQQYMQMQQQLKDAQTQQALGFITAMAEVIPMVSAGKGLLRSAQAMAKPSVLGSPGISVTDEARLIADQYDEARRLSDEITPKFPNTDLDSAIQEQMTQEYIRLADPTPYARRTNPYYDLEELELLIQNNHGSDAFKADGSLDFDYLKREEGIDLEKPLDEWDEEHYLNDYDNFHAAFVASRRQDPDMLRQSLERMPTYQYRGRQEEFEGLTQEAFDYMQNKKLERLANDPKIQRDYFEALQAKQDSLDEYVAQNRSELDDFFADLDTDGYEYDEIDDEFFAPEFGPDQWMDPFEYHLREKYMTPEINRREKKYMTDALFPRWYSAPRANILSDRQRMTALQRPVGDYYKPSYAGAIEDLTTQKFERLKQLEPEVNAFLLDLEEGIRGLDLSSTPASQATSKSIGGLTEYFEEEMKDNIQEYFQLKGEIETQIGRPLLDVRPVQKEYSEIQGSSLRIPSQIEMQDYITKDDEIVDLMERISRPEMQMNVQDFDELNEQKYQEIINKVDAMKNLPQYKANLPGTAAKGVDMSDAFADYAKARAEVGLMFLPVVGGLYDQYTGGQQEQEIQAQLDVLQDEMTEEERAEAEKRLKEQEEQRPQYETNWEYR